ncbi:MAG: iron-sulfur cluster assembly scaffold protein [Rhodospirillaceae bacterium]|nr:iron-sulfur cluster assembly scaffold protein [Rhodospirillaceae bacterium]
MKTPISSLYQDKLIDLAGQAVKLERLEFWDATATAVSQACGSSVTVDLLLNGEVISAVGQNVDACALGSASSVIASSKLVGKSYKEIYEIRQELVNMLRNNGPVPRGEWSELGLFEAAKDLKNRHQSILLVFDAVLSALGK